MFYYLNQTVLSVMDNYTVIDELGSVVYTVKSPSFSWTSRFTFFDADKNEVAYVKRFVSYVPSFVWYPDKKHAKNEFARGVAESDVKLTKNDFTITLPDDVEWKVSGDFLAWNFVIKHGDEVVATVSKNKLDLTDRYKIDLANEVDALNVFITVVVIDNSTHSKSLRRVFQ